WKPSHQKHANTSVVVRMAVVLVLDVVADQISAQGAADTANYGSGTRCAHRRSNQRAAAGAQRAARQRPRLARSKRRVASADYDSDQQRTDKSDNFPEACM